MYIVIKYVFELRFRNNYDHVTKSYEKSEKDYRVSYLSAI